MTINEKLTVCFCCCNCKTDLVFNKGDLICPNCGFIPKSFEIFDFSFNFNDNVVQPNNSSDELYKYIFVFSKPLSVTDIQYQELFQLLQDNSKENVILSFYDKGPFQENGLPDHCSAQVIQFEHSCLVISNCIFDLHTIVRNSGYIHSAGYSVYLKKWMDVNTTDVSKALSGYIKRSNKKYKIYFYTDQQSTEEEKKVSGITIDHQRTYIGTKFFHIEKHNIENDLKEYCENNGIEDDGGVIFVYKDMLNIKADYLLYPEQNDIHYMVVYHSICKKENPIHDLDEDRPYWAGIYTTPHTLTCAMVNLARISSGDIVYDPFLHMGTTAIEAAKYDCIVLGSDLNEPLGARDNYDFVFHNNLGKVIDNLGQLMSGDYHLRCYEIVAENIHKDVNDAFVNTESIEKLIKTYPELEGYERRLLFYIVRRFVLRDLQGIKQVDDLKKYVLNQINKFRKYLEIRNINYCNPMGWIPDENTSKFVDDYNIQSLRIGPLKSAFSEFHVFQANANRFPLQDNSVNAIITDPPYGYGDDIEPYKLANLYANFISESFRVLKSSGKLEMCMLDKVKTGKAVSSNTMTKGVIGLINKIAIEKKIRFTRQEVIPLSNVLSLHYWKSKHALNRAIINLEIFKE